MEIEDQQMEHYQRVLSLVRGLVEESSAIVATDEDLQTNLFELGMDSLMLMEMSQNVEKRLGVKLPYNLFFDQASTIEKLTHLLAESIPEVADEVQPSLPETSAPATTASPAVDMPDLSGQQLTEAEVLEPGPQQVVLAQLKLMSQQLAMLSGAPLEVSPAVLSGFSARDSIPATGSPDVSSTVPSPEVEPAPTPSPTTRKENKPFVAFRQVVTEANDHYTPQQRTHLNALISTFSEKLGASKEHIEKYRQVLTTNRYVAGFRPEWKELIVTMVADRAQGSRIWDVKGQEYLDISMGFGVHFFGHNPSFVKDAVQQAVAEGMPLGPLSSKTGKVAELVCEMTGMDRVAFYNSGTEAVMVAVRLARSLRKKDKLIIFSGSYHGMFDGILALSRHRGEKYESFPMSPGTPKGHVEDVLALDYGDPASLETIRRYGNEIAAVLVEPVQSRNVELQPKAFLQELREITRETESLLIFDEVISGFRVHPAGAQGYFGIEADLAIYGKTVGGGLPIGLVAGRGDYMNGIDGGHWAYGDDSLPQEKSTFTAGTFCHHPLAMAAAHAVLSELKAAGPEIQKQVTRRTQSLIDQLNQVFIEEEVSIRVVCFGSLFRFIMRGDQELLFYHLLQRGIYIWEGRNCFLATAHTDKDVSQIVQAVRESIQAMRDGGFFPPKQESTQIPMSEGQKTMWLFLKTTPQAALAYHEKFLFRLKGPLEIPVLERAIQVVIQRHEALRTLSFDGEQQTVATSHRFKLEFQDFSQSEGKGKDQLVEQFLSKQVSRIFDFEEGPFLRVSCLKIEESTHLLHWVLHHIVVDGWSIVQIWQETVELYNLKIRNETQITLPSPVTASQYWEWLETRPIPPEASVFWKGQFNQGVDLVWKNLTPSVFQGASYQTIWESEITQQFKQFCQQQQSSPFMTLFALFTLFISKLAQKSCFLIGVPAAGQALMGEKALIASCAQVLPIVVKVDPQSSFLELSGQCQQTLSNAFSYQNDLPSIAEASEVQVLFNLDRIDLPEMESMQMFWEPTGIHATKYPLNLNVMDWDTHLELNFEYRSDVFDETAIRIWSDEFQQILLQVFQNPDVLCQDLPEPSALMAEIEGKSAGFDAPVQWSVLPPRNPLEAQILEIWKELLEVDQLGVEQSFFQMGGHSLTATRMINRLSQDLGVEVSIREFFYAQTISELAALIQDSVANPIPRIIPLPPQPDYAVSHAQKRLLILDQLQKTSVYNMPSAYLWEGNLNIPVLQTCFERLIQRHESLRTTFFSKGGEFRQKIHDTLDFRILEVDFSRKKDPEASARAYEAEQAWLPFDLEQGPLIRVTLVKLAATQYLFMFNLHHIIGDGWSLVLLVKEMVRLYDALVQGQDIELPTLPIQYRDYVAWQNTRLDSEEMQRQQTYWKEQCDGELPVLQLPYDFPRPEQLTHETSRVKFSLEPELFKRVYGLCGEWEVSPFMVMTSLVTVLLYHLSGQEDIIIGTPVAGRNHPDLENQFGFYLNTLPLRNRVTSHDSFQSLLEQVKASATAAYEHQEYPFDLIVETLELPRNPSRNPLFDVMVILQNNDDYSLDMHEVQTRFFKDEIVTSQFDLTFNFEEIGTTLITWIEYQTSLFHAETVERFAKQLRKLFEVIVEDAERPLQNLDALFLNSAQRHEQKAFLEAIDELGEEF